MPLNKATNTVITGKFIALQLGSSQNDLQDMPISKCEMARSSDKGEATTSASVFGDAPSGNAKVFKEYGQGPSSQTMSIGGRWKRGQNIHPTDIEEGATYFARAFYRKAGSLSTTDIGHYEEGYIYIDSRRAPLDISSGAIEWSIEATCQGQFQTVGSP